MKHSAILPAAFALALGAAGLAQAQGTTTAPGTTPSSTQTGAPATVTTPSAPTAMAPSTSTGAPVVSGTASATNNAVNTNPQNNGALTPGANSFTRGEARRRILKDGYKQVSGLKLDRQGIWRGKATKGGHTVNVSMDYQGNIVSQ